MLLIGWVLWIVIVAGACYRLGKPSIWHRIFFVVVATVLVLAPHWDVILGAPAMRRACREQAGLQKYEPVELPLASVMIIRGGANIRGGAPVPSCLTCSEVLIRGLALETQSRISHRHDSLALTDQAGLMRYWRAPVGDPNCKAFEALPHEEKRSIWKSAGASYDGTSCIASRRIDAPSAAFVLTEPVRRSWQVGVLKVIEGAVELRRASGQPVATLKYLRQWPWSGQQFYFALPPVPSCPSFDGFETPIIRDGNLPLALTPAILLRLLARPEAHEEIFD